MNVNFSLIHRLILTVVIMSAATILQLMVWPHIQPTPILFFYPAILISCLYAEGISSIIIGSLVIQYFFIPPYDTLHLYFPRDFIVHLIFLPSALLIKVIADNLLTLKKKLERTIRNLEEEKKLREKFVSTLTHDLQTPLMAMKMTSQMMIKARLEEDVFKKNCQRLQSNMTRLENMIKDLLDANKLRAGKNLPLKIQEMDLNDCINETLEELTHIYGPRFSYQQQSHLIGFWCKDAIQRIIENLCTNAIKYGFQNSPITIRTESLIETINIEIHNNGPVIEKKEMDYLFNAFEQSRSSQISKKKGWGLGLTLVQGLTEAMHGKVSVRSNHDAGTTFIIELPRDARIPRKKE